MTYEHACDSTATCARGGSLCSRAFVKGAYSRLSCSIHLRDDYKRGLRAIQAGQRHHGRFGTPEEETGGEGRGEATFGEPVLATTLWSIIYAVDAGVVSQSPEQLRKRMGVIHVVCISV